jgi:hypothetical protein
MVLQGVSVVSEIQRHNFDTAQTMVRDVHVSYTATHRFWTGQTKRSNFLAGTNWSYGVLTSMISSSSPMTSTARLIRSTYLATKAPSNQLNSRRAYFSFLRAHRPKLASETKGRNQRTQMNQRSLGSASTSISLAPVVIGDLTRRGSSWRRWDWDGSSLITSLEPSKSSSQRNVRE